ncbi:MAG: flagellar biosynthesis protein FliQ [Lachnospiraceae bacterium]|nr:flagellar biosynthesis protein FliQ [Lachnospiraceae bacterium]
MTIGDVTQIVSEALWLIIKVGAPVLLISLIVGLVVSVFQTATSIQEQTLTFVPKVLSIFLAIIVLGNWMATEITDYIHALWGNFSNYIR